MFVGVMLVGLSSLGSAQQVVLAVPEYIPPVSFSEILKVLGDESVNSYFDKNRDLGREIDARGIGFGFGQNAREVLIKAGASEGVISKITDGQEKRSKEIRRLWEELGKNRNGIVPNRAQTEIAIGRELRDRIGDPELLMGEERGWSGVYEYLKTYLPKWEANLERARRSRPDQ